MYQNLKYSLFQLSTTFFFGPSILDMCTKCGIIVEYWQLAFNYGMRIPESGDDGKEENNSVLACFEDCNH